MGWESIPGWFSWSDVYDEMVDGAVDGDTIVEIGVAFGRSVAYLARKAIDAKKRLNIYAIDPWYDDWWMFPSNYPASAQRPTWGAEHAEWARAQGGPFNAFVAMMRQHAPQELEYINVLKGYSWQYAKLFESQSLRGVLIDGDHNYEGCARDIRDWRARVKSDGILAGDDHSPAEFPGVVRACEEAFGPASAGGYEVRRDWIWVKK